MAQVLHAHHLPPTLQTAEASGTAQIDAVRDSMEAFEKDALLDALKSASGNRAKAARLLVDDGADLQLPRPQVRHRLAAVQEADASH